MTIDGLVTEYGSHRGQRMVTTGMLLAITSSIAVAQQVGNPATLLPREEVEEIPRYAVELIVFGYNDGSAVDTELFMPDAVPAEDVLLAEVPLQEFANDDQPDTTMTQAMGAPTEQLEEFLPPPFTEEELVLNEILTHEQAGLKVLDPSEYVLNDIYDKLVELDAYTPLVRTAWSQQTLERDLTTPIKLRRLGNSPLRLNGTITLYLSRYLHLVVDLALDDKVARPDRDEDGSYYGDHRRQSDSAFGLGQGYRSTPVHYRIVEDRIVRNGELRYYDHPKFGVLAKITRVEEVRQEIETMTLPIGATDN